MKHLKTFENKIKGKYYACHKEPTYLRKQLQKLNCTEKQIENIIDDTSYFTHDIVFVGKKGQSVIVSPDGIPLERKGYIFQRNGLDLTTDEIDDVNTKISTNKYNL